MSFYAMPFWNDRLFKKKKTKMCCLWMHAVIKQTSLKLLLLATDILRAFILLYLARVVFIFKWQLIKTIWRDVRKLFQSESYFFLFREKTIANALEYSICHFTTRARGLSIPVWRDLKYLYFIIMCFLS